MKPLQRRIEALEAKIKARTGVMIPAFYKDGSTRRIYPGEAIKLSLEEGELIERFEEEPGGRNEGIVEALANAILLPGED